MRKNGYMKPCKNCGNDFRVTPSSDARYNRQYCSVACKCEAATKRGNPTHYTANAWKVYERRCHDCGYDEYPEIIIIHHIDGNRKNGNIDNLIPVCQNCHAARHIELARVNPRLSSKAVSLGGPAVRHISRELVN